MLHIDQTASDQKMARRGKESKSAMQRTTDLRE